MLKHLKIITFGIYLVVNCNINAQKKVYKEHYDNGKLKLEGFKNEQGVPVGAWTYFKKDGAKDVELNFNEKGVPQGDFIMYYSNSQVQTKGYYSGQGNFEMEGNYEDYYENGQLASKGKYKNNERIGKWVSYWENGQINSLEEYTEKGVIQKSTYYFNNGQLKYDAKYNKYGDLIGEVIWYYPNGQKHTEQTYDVDGFKIGKYASFYENGRLMELGEYAGTNYFQKKGTWKTYHQNGNLKRKITYDEDGKIVGDIKKYDEKGNLILPKK